MPKSWTPPPPDAGTWAKPGGPGYNYAYTVVMRKFPTATFDDWNQAIEYVLEAVEEMTRVYSEPKSSHCEDAYERLASGDWIPTKSYFGAICKTRSLNYFERVAATRNAHINESDISEGSEVEGPGYLSSVASTAPTPPEYFCGIEDREVFQRCFKELTSNQQRMVNAKMGSLDKTTSLHDSAKHLGITYSTLQGHLSRIYALLRLCLKSRSHSMSLMEGQE